MVGAMTKDDDKARLRQSIDDNLKRVYDDALGQEVPERFTDLLNQLREAEARKKGQKEGGA
jgi:hypothetical protein